MQARRLPVLKVPAVGLVRQLVRGRVRVLVR
jgi:hypothetical protein